MVKCDTVIHDYYTVHFSKLNNIPQLVTYKLIPEHSNKLHNYRGFFTIDITYSSIGALSKYYKNSGFDRGHLYPAEDASFDKNNFRESYYETNMCPQKVDFNRGIWKKLETSLRKLSKTDSLYIITGPDLYNETFQYLNKITIPNYYFKIVLNYTKHSLDIYYIPNKKGSRSLSFYLISIDEFEKNCGIYFNREFISKLIYAKRY